MSAANPIQFHARLAKYDEATHQFTAIATDETIDKTKERLHYDSSKPLFADWAGEFHKATDGKSVGNLRSMHGKNAAGKLNSLICDDEHKQIIITGEIVDPNDQLKMAKGVYTGVSIGGDCVKKWADPDNAGVMFYTARPFEVSLVDNPCNPNARFKLHKADGAEVDVEFTKEETPDPEKLAVEQIAKVFDSGKIKPTDVVKFIESEQAKVTEAAKVESLKTLKAKLADEKLTIGELEALAKVHLPADQQNGDVATLVERLAAIAVPAVVEKRDFSQAERDTAADKGQAMPDGSYPIKSTADLKNAIQAIGRAKNPDAVKRHIKRRAAALGASSMIPDTWGKATPETLPIEKGLYMVGIVANILDQLVSIADSCEYEATMEGDGSGVPAHLQMICEDLGECLCEMAEEESQEATAKVVVAELKKNLEKIGARNSKADQNRLQTIHDHSVDMGANCAASAKSTGVGTLAKALGIETTTAIEELEKTVVAFKTDALKWRGQPVRKGAVRPVAKGEADPATPKDETEKGAGAADLSKPEGLLAHIKNVHKGVYSPE